MGQNSLISSFFARRAKKASVEGRSPPQELEVDLRSGPYLLVIVKVKYILFKYIFLVVVKIIEKWSNLNVRLSITFCLSIPSGHTALLLISSSTKFMEYQISKGVNIGTRPNKRWGRAKC